MHDLRQYFNENKLVRMIFLRLALSVLSVKVSRAAGMQFAHPLRMKIHLQQDDDDDDDDGARSRITFARRRAQPFDAKIMRHSGANIRDIARRLGGIERSRGKTMRMRCAVARSPSGNARTRWGQNEGDERGKRQCEMSRECMREYIRTRTYTCVYFIFAVAARFFFRPSGDGIRARARARTC